MKKYMVASVTAFLLVSAMPVMSQMPGINRTAETAESARIGELLDAKKYSEARLLIKELLPRLEPEDNFNPSSDLEVIYLLSRYVSLSRESEFLPTLTHWIDSVEITGFDDQQLVLLVRSINNTGVALKNAARLTDSRNCYLRALEILQHMETPDMVMLGSIYANIGNSLKQIGEFERSVDYMTQALNRFNESLSRNPSPEVARRIAISKALTLNNLGLVYQTLDDFSTSCDLFYRCIEIIDDNGITSLDIVFVNLTISLVKEHRLTEAEQIIHQVLSKYQNPTRFDRIWVKSCLNDVLIKLELHRDTLAASIELENVLQIIEKNLPGENDLISEAVLLQAGILADIGRFESADERINMALNRIATNPAGIAPGFLSQNIRTHYTNELIDLLTRKSDIYRSWGRATGDLRILDQALVLYGHTTQVVDSVRTSLQLQSSKNEVSRRQRFLFEQAISLSHELYAKTHNEKYLQLLFNFIEKSKSAGLLNAMQDSDVKSGSIPSPELQKETELKEQVTEVMGLLAELRSASSPDSVRISQLEQKEFSLNLKIDSLIRGYQSRFPDYYQSKHNKTVISLDESRALLGSDQVMLQYSFTNDALFCIASTRAETKVMKIPIDSTLLSDMSYLVEFMTGKPQYFNREAKDRFCSSSANLYKTLISPFERMIGNRELIVLPDGLLNQVPFDILFKPQADPGPSDFHLFSYLIRSNVITYSQSASLYHFTLSRKVKPAKSVLAVSPSYNLLSGNSSAYLQSQTGELPYLQGTVAESRIVRRLFKGKLLKADRAQEENFKKLYSRYAVLHLAMHTVTDEVNPLNSCLVFTPGSDTKEDGILFCHEIYNLSFNAHLAVLSACETGSGQALAGEGIMSLARAFKFAGCSNLILAQWKVDDRSSQEIMRYFYTDLKKEKSAKALQNSKLKYLEQSNQLHAHPHFWAAFAHYGKNSMIQIPEKRLAWWLFLVVPLLSMILVIFWKKKDPLGGRGSHKNQES